MDRETASIKQDLENLKNKVNSLADKYELVIESLKPKSKKQKE